MTICEATSKRIEQLCLSLIHIYTLWKLAERGGRFICIERPLMYYRVHEEATTKACIKDNSRVREEAEMFAKMWPKPVVKLLMHYYRRAYEEYE